MLDSVNLPVYSLFGMFLFFFTPFSHSPPLRPCLSPLSPSHECHLYWWWLLESTHTYPHNHSLTLGWEEEERRKRRGRRGGSARTVGKEHVSEKAEEESLPLCPCPCLRSVPGSIPTETHAFAVTAAAFPPLDLKQSDYHSGSPLSVPCCCF